MGASEVRLIICLAAAGLCVMGCTTWGTHPDSVETCERGFANDPDWRRDAWPGLRARRLAQRFPSLEFNEKTYQPSKASTLWFENDTSDEVGSCSMHSCATGQCIWRIRLYSRVEDRWRIRSEYDIGQARKVTGR